MIRTLGQRLAAIEAAERAGGPVVAFPDGRDEVAFFVEGRRYERDADEPLEVAARRVAARVRPGARVVVWPIPMRPDLEAVRA